MEPEPHFAVYQDEAQDWRWKLVGGNGEVMCAGEAHTCERDAIRAFLRVVDAAWDARQNWLSAT